MVLEIAEFTITPGREDGFAAAYGSASALLRETPGFLSARMTRGIETPDHFFLIIEWESLEAHTVNFRQSDRFPKWRALIGPFFAVDPRVQHAHDVS